MQSVILTYRAAVCTFLIALGSCWKSILVIVANRAAIKLEQVLGLDMASTIAAVDGVCRPTYLFELLMDRERY